MASGRGGEAGRASLGTVRVHGMRVACAWHGMCVACQLWPIRMSAVRVRPTMDCGPRSTEASPSPSCGGPSQITCARGGNGRVGGLDGRGERGGAGLPSPQADQALWGDLPNPAQRWERAERAYAAETAPSFWSHPPFPVCVE